MENRQTDLELKEYIWIFYKHRWAITTLFVSILALTVIYIFMAVPMYRASTRVLIEKETPNVVDFKEIYAIDTTTQEFYQTQYKILESRHIAGQVITALSLWDHKDFAPPAPARDTISDEESLKRETFRRERTINRFLANMRVVPFKNTRIVMVSYDSPSPDLAAKVANALVRAYMDYTMSMKLQMSTGVTEFLNRNILEQRVKLEESEKLLQEYKKDSNIISLEEEEKITVQKLASLSSDLMRANNERIEAEVKYMLAKEMMADPERAVSIPQVMASSFVNKLKNDEAVLGENLSEVKSKYGNKHPRVIAIKERMNAVRSKLSEEIVRIVNSLNGEFEAAKGKEEALRRELVALKEESQQLGQHAVAYSVLARDVEMNNQMFEVLLKRLKETSITGGLQNISVSVLDPAVTPSVPYKPRKLVSLLLALLVSLLLGPLFALVLDYLDNSIKTPDDIGRYVKIPYLGPLLDFREQMPESGDTSVLVTDYKPKSIAAEAYRSVRTSLIFSSPEEHRKILLVTSSNPVEGKSVTSANLAVTMAQNGVRTMLVDMDFRRPVLHKVFGVKQEKGLTNLLVGDAELDQIIVKSRIENLDIIPSGHIPPNPAELLNSGEIKKLIKALRDRYDQIIIDSPPILSATDPVIISTYVDEVLLVIRIGVTSRELARMAAERLAHVNANLIGAVLNFVDAGRRNYYYYQTYYYQYYYGEGKEPGRLDSPFGKFRKDIMDRLKNLPLFMKKK